MGEMMLTYRATNALSTKSGCGAVLTMFCLPEVGRCQQNASCQQKKGGVTKSWALLGFSQELGARSYFIGMTCRIFVTQSGTETHLVREVTFLEEGQLDPPVGKISYTKINAGGAKRSVENTQNVPELYPGLTIQSRPCRLQADFGLVITNSCLSSSQH